MATIRVGVSGWSYAHWRNGAFFPPSLPRKDELPYLARRFDSVEVNGSFYSLLRPETYRRYARATSRRFRFAVKGSRFITHAKKLKDVQTPLANFFASGILRLEEKLGPILWQLPAVSWAPERVTRFLALLPEDHDAASALARRHDERVTGRASMVVHRNHRLRHALEPRHPGHLTDEVVRACRDHGVALVFADSGDWPYTEEITAGFVYLRLHGSPRTYRSDYGVARLSRWADRITAWRSGEEPPDAERLTDLRPPPRKGRDVYAYFDNDHDARAPRNALELRRILEGSGS